MGHLVFAELAIGQHDIPEVQGRCAAQRLMSDPTHILKLSGHK
jgi:hypothetical protein